MSKMKGYIAIVLLLLSWLALYWLTGSRTPWNQFHAGSDKNSVSVYLGDIQTQNYDRMGFTRAVVHYAEKEQGWIVGTERGELFLFDNEGQQRWKRSLGIGKLVSLALTHDGSLALVGEVSPEGKIYAVNVHTGDIAWQKKGADFVGSDASQRSYPSIVHIVVDKEDNIYANAYRFLMRKDGSRGYNGRMMAVSKGGELLWQFPKDEPMDSWINWCDVSDANGRAVLSTSAYDFHPEMKYKDTMYFIDKKTGAELNSTFLPPVEPFDNTVMRGSPNFSADGKYLAAAASDGRGFLFDEKGQLLWSRFISKPAQVDGAWLNASGRDGYVTPQGVLFTTINTFNRENWQLPTPVEHPSNNSVFVFNLDGSYRYQFMAQATMEDLAFNGDGSLLACAIGRNVRTHNYKAHGALVLDLASSQQQSFFATEGPCQAIGISPDGSWVAGVEAPALTPQGKIIGAYRLHIWKNTLKAGGEAHAQ